MADTDQDVGAGPAHSRSRSASASASAEETPPEAKRARLEEAMVKIIFTTSELVKSEPEESPSNEFQGLQGGDAGRQSGPERAEGTRGKKDKKEKKREKKEKKEKKDKKDKRDRRDRKGKARTSYWEFSLPRSWLRTEYFEAFLSRWSDGGNGSESMAIKLRLPEGSDAREGAELFRERISREQDRVLSPIEWWYLVDGDEAALLLALFIFDLVMWEKFAKEVAFTLKRFEVICPGDFGIIARKYDDSVCISLPESEAPRSSHSIGHVDRETLRKILADAVTAKPGSSYVRKLANRVILTVPPDHDSALMEMLVSTLFAVLGLHNCSPQQQLQVPDNTRKASMTWLRGHLRETVLRSPNTSKRLLDYFVPSPYYEPHYTVCRDVGAVRDGVAAAMLDVVHVLLKESFRLRHSSCHGNFANLRALEHMSQIFTNEFADSAASYILDGLREACLGSLNMAVFGVAPVAAQQLLMQAFEDRCGKVLSNNARLVRPELRHLLLKHLPDLSVDSKRFLAEHKFSRNPVFV